MHGPICTIWKQYEWVGLFVSCMTLTTDLTCDLAHEFPRSNNRIAIFSKYLTSSPKTSEFFVWVHILIVINIWYPFSFHHMLQCRPDVTFLSMETLVWSYHYCDGDFVYLRHNTCLSAVFGFHFINTPIICEIHTIHVTRTQKIE